MVLGWILRAGFEESCGLIRELDLGCGGRVYPRLEGRVGGD